MSIDSYIEHDLFGIESGEVVEYTSTKSNVVSASRKICLVDPIFKIPHRKTGVGSSLIRIRVRYKNCLCLSGKLHSY